MIKERLEEYVSLTQLKKTLEGELEGCKADIASLEAQLLEDFANDGVTSLRTEGGQTVYVQRMLWAGAVDGDKARACEALRRAGLGELVEPSFNVNSLSAVVREWDKAGQPLPPAFLGETESQRVERGGEVVPAIRVSEKYNVRVRG